MKRSIFLLFFFSQVSLGTATDLSNLSSSLIQLSNLHKKIEPVHCDQPSYLSDPDLYEKLLERTNTPAVKEKLRRGIEELKALPTEFEQLAKYLLHFLFEHKPLAARYRRDGAYPNLVYQIGQNQISADYSTDLITRILIAVNVVRDVRSTWLPTDQICIVSLAGGYLLQDYIIIKALFFSGYNNIKVSVIDYGNSTNELEEIIKKDKSLCNLKFATTYHRTTTQFFSKANSESLAINACCLVSPTIVSPNKIPGTALKKMLDDREINFLKIGNVLERSIRFYIPNNMNYIIAKSDIGVDTSFVKKIIEQLNQSLMNHKSLPNAFVELGKSYSEDLYVADDIMLDFYDIIKNSSLKNCFGYMAFEDKLNRYSDLKDEPYWALNYNIKDKAEYAIIWTYNSDKMRFEQL